MTLKGRKVMNELEVTNLKQELEEAKSANQFLSTKVRKLETASNQTIKLLETEQAKISTPVASKQPKIGTIVTELSKTTTPIVALMPGLNTSVRIGKEPTRKRRKC